MLEQLILAATVAGGMNALIGSIAIRRIAFLEQKIGLLWHLILVQGLAMLLVWVAMLVGARQIPRLPLAGDVSLEQLRAHLVASRDHRMDELFAVASIPLLLVLLVPSALHVLRECKAFVLAQRADLLARDQVAAWEGSAKSASKPATSSTS